MSDWLNDILKASPAKSAGDPLSMTSSTAAPQAEAGPHAVELDRWGVRRGQDLYKASHELRHLLQGDAAPEAAAADLHGLCFEHTPTLLDACRDEARLRFVREVQSQPDYQSLHASTAGQDLASEIGTVALAQGLAKARKAREDNEPKDGDGKAQAQAKAARAAVASRVAAAGAVAKAREEVEKAQDTAEGFGLGAGAGQQVDRAQLKRCFDRVRNSHFLKAVFDLAGRYRRLAKARQRSKVTHGADEVVGVRPDGDVSRLLPVELGLLADPDLELDVLRRLVENQCLCRETRASEKAARGPVMVFVDCSGSMSSQGRIYHAKALALTLAWVAKRQKRWVALVNFSDARTAVTLPPGRWDDSALAAWLEWFEGGGTDLPLHHWQLESLFATTQAPRGKTDIVVITDGVWSFPWGEERRAETMAWLSRNKARVISLVVGHAAGDLANFSNETHLLAGISPDSPGVGEALSI